MALWKRGVLAHLHANAFCMTINVRVQNDVCVAGEGEGEGEGEGRCCRRRAASWQAHAVKGGNNWRRTGRDADRVQRSQVGHVGEI